MASGGFSNATGMETGTSNYNKKGTSSTQSTGSTQAGGRQQTIVSPWAREGNAVQYGQSFGDERNARDFLSALISDPYSGGGGRFGDAINHQYDLQLARARSGDTQSLGTGKAAFREGAALENARQGVIGEGMGAANSLLGANGTGNALNFERLVSPTRSKGHTQSLGAQTTQFDETGRNAQQANSTGNSWGLGGGITCCFIFLEAYNGVLPWWVRECRDAFCSGLRVRGYRRMSEWLVPAMRLYAPVRALVNWTLVRPLTAWGGWLYVVEGHSHGWVAYPLVAAWFSVWKWLGKEAK